MKKIRIVLLLLISIFILSCTEIDIVNPTISVSFSSITITKGDTINLVEEYGVTVTDNQDENITIHTNITDTSTLELGVYLVEFTAEDHSGNQAIEQTTLIVENSFLGFFVEESFGTVDGAFNQVLEPVVLNQRAFVLYQTLLTPNLSSDHSEAQVFLLIYDSLSASMRSINITEPQYNALPIGIFAVENGYNIIINIQESVDDPYTVWVYHFDSGLEFMYRSELKEGISTLHKVVLNTEGDFAIVYESSIEFYSSDETYICEVTKDSSYVINDVVAVGNTFVFVGEHEGSDSTQGFIISHNPQTESYYLIEDTECNVQNIYYEKVSDANGKLYITAWFEDATSGYSAVIECSYDGEYITEHTYLPTDLFTLFSLVDGPVGFGPYESTLNQDTMNTYYLFGNGLHTENRIDFETFHTEIPRVFFQIGSQYYIIVIDSQVRISSYDDISSAKTVSLVKIDIK